MRSLAIGFIIISTCYITLAQDNSAVDRLLEEADIALERSDFNNSLEKVERALAQSPRNINALQKRINIYYQMNNMKEASKLADDAIKDFPSEPEFHYLKGLINIAKEKYYRALDEFNIVMDLNKPIDLYKVYLNRGVAYLNIKDYDLAMDDLTKSIELNGTNASAYHSRGMVYYDLEDYKMAVDNFTRAIELSQDNPVTFFNLGMSYFRLEDKENACPYFHKACSMGDENGCRMALMECAKSLPR